ncbi:hypothetical protein F2P79_025760 [Pimephales promelas]|nr:hypothetical protein F2P79_025760 [Pimephales promelas]
MFCDPAKRQDLTSTTSASSNRGSLPNTETKNQMDNRTKPAVTPESELKCGNVKSSTEHAVMTTIYQLPHEIIATGDSAYLMLSLVCRWFRDVVTNEIFQKAAHFAWLNSVVYWKKISPDYCDEFRRIYSFRECSECLELFKSYPPGYRGRGKRGELLGFYSEALCTGFCSQDCFFCCRK